MKLKQAIIFVIISMLFIGCTPIENVKLEESDIELIQFEKPKDGQDIAIIETSLGDVTIALYPDKAPETVAHFKKLVESGFYDNKDVYTHSYIEMMTMGFSEETTEKGEILTDNKKPVKTEASEDLWHFSGCVSVLGYTNSPFSRQRVSDSRFFILGDNKANPTTAQEMEEQGYPKKLIDAYKEHGGFLNYSGVYTVFGHVIDGMEIVNEISAIKNPDGETNKPIQEVKINSIKLSVYKQ